jgi:predicted nucleic acid-binding protein
MSSLFLVDTSLWTCLIRRRGHEAEREQVRALMLSGRAAWCDPVRLELWRGVNSDYDREMLTLLAREVPLLPVDADTWRLACRLADVGRRKGWRFPSQDLLIFGCAHQHGVTVLSRDQHYEQLVQLLPLLRKTDN